VSLRVSGSISFKKRAYLIFPIWLASVFWLWSWWIAQIQGSFIWIYIPLTIALIYETTIMPGVLLGLTLYAKVPAKRRPQKDKKVAVITLCVPSQESIEIIEKQLLAISNISYKHDSWILDEGNSKHIKQLARKYHVKYFSRKGIAKYNQKNFPYEKKTKAGNVNAWLDHVKRRKYEFFVQLDIDHLPNVNYLNKTLGHFRDPDVAWVQSPSVYSNTNNWIARGSGEQDMGMHGPMQMGFYGANDCPIIVGSHAAYRTIAIQQIGGFQPTRAEDQLNTLVLASKGWKGVFVPEVLAQGRGPETLSAYLTQQYAWARSVIFVIKGYSWKYLTKLSPRKFLQFIFLQTWYPIAAITFLILYFTPILALSFNLQIINVNIQQFLIRILPFILVSILLLWSAKPLMQPKKLKYTWRGILLHLIRWPAIISGIFSAIFNIKKPYLVTPKGKFLNKIPTINLYKYFIIQGLISSASVIYASLVYTKKTFQGQSIFAIYDAIIMLGICLIDLNIRIKQNNIKTKTYIVNWLKPLSAILAFMVIVGVAVTIAIIVPLKANYNLKYSLPVNEIQKLNKVPIYLLNSQQLYQQIESSSYKLNKNLPIPSLGIYSPYIKVYNKKPYINSIFIDWTQSWMLARGLVESNRTGATPLVTIEPKGDNNGAQLLRNISLGVYDKRLLRLFNIIKLDPNTVYVRFAQEMDLPNSFPWGYQKPSLYIAAYKYVVNLARGDGVHNVQWVWSPAGLPSAALYYPGNQYVNIIGTTMIYSRYWSGAYHPTFKQVESPRSWLLSYHKPVWIVEFGVGKSDQAYQTKLIKSALSEYKSDGYQALVYLNIPEPNIKGPNYTLKHVSILDGIFTTKPKSIIYPKVNSKIQTTTHTIRPSIKLLTLFENFQPQYQIIRHHQTIKLNIKNSIRKLINHSRSHKKIVINNKYIWFIYKK
jgi:cellulose synthase (UDP-forming)